MEDQLAIKEKLKKNQMDKTKLVSHFKGGGGGGRGVVVVVRNRLRGRGREKRREEEEEEEGIEEKKGMDFVWIFMGFYGLVWILV